MSLAAGTAGIGAAAAGGAGSNNTWSSPGHVVGNAGTGGGGVTSGGTQNVGGSFLPTTLGNYFSSLAGGAIAGGRGVDGPDYFTNKGEQYWFPINFPGTGGGGNSATGGNGGNASWGSGGGGGGAANGTGVTGGNGGNGGPGVCWIWFF